MGWRPTRWPRLPEAQSPPRSRTAGGSGPPTAGESDVIGGGLVIGSDSLMSRESVGRLVEVVSDFPERFTGMFEYDGQERQEELVLTGSSNMLIRNGVAYRRCSVAGPTG